MRLSDILHEYSKRQAPVLVTYDGDAQIVRIPEQDRPVEMLRVQTLQMRDAYLRFEKIDYICEISQSDWDKVVERTKLALSLRADDSDVMDKNMLVIGDKGVTH